MDKVIKYLKKLFLSFFFSRVQDSGIKISFCSFSRFFSLSISLKDKGQRLRVLLFSRSKPLMVKNSPSFRVCLGILVFFLYRLKFHSVHRLDKSDYFCFELSLLLFFICPSCCGLSSDIFINSADGVLLFDEIIFISFASLVFIL